MKQKSPESQAAGVDDTVGVTVGVAFGVGVGVFPRHEIQSPQSGEPKYGPPGPENSSNL